jgi:hypothetical protein
MAVVLVADHQIDGAQPQAGEGFLELQFGDLEADPRMVGPQPDQRGDQQAAGARLEAAGPDGAAHVAAERGQVRLGGLGGLGGRQQDPGVLSEQATGVGEPDAPAGLLEQPGAGLLFQPGQLLGDRRRAVAQGGTG